MAYQAGLDQVGQQRSLARGAVGVTGSISAWSMPGGGGLVGWGLPFFGGCLCDDLGPPRPNCRVSAGQLGPEAGYSVRSARARPSRHASMCLPHQAPRLLPIHAASLAFSAAVSGPCRSARTFAATHSRRRMATTTRSTWSERLPSAAGWGRPWPDPHRSRRASSHARRARGRWCAGLAPWPGRSASCSSRRSSSAFSCVWMTSKSI
jgi:hypothetical protein